MQNVSLRDHPARGESGTWWITNLKLRLEEAARHRGATTGKPGCRDVSMEKFWVQPLQSCAESAPTGLRCLNI